MRYAQPHTSCLKIKKNSESYVTNVKPLKKNINKRNIFNHLKQRIYNDLI